MSIDRLSVFFPNIILQWTFSDTPYWTLLNKLTPELIVVTYPLYFYIYVPRYLSLYVFALFLFFRLSHVTSIYYRAESISLPTDTKYNTVFTLSYFSDTIFSSACIFRIFRFLF